MIGKVDDRNRALINLEVRRTPDSQGTKVTAWIDTAFDGHLVFPLPLIQELGLQSLVASSYPRDFSHPLVNKPFPVRAGIAWFGRFEFSGDPSAEVTVAASNTQTGDSRGQLLQSQRCQPRADTRCYRNTSS